MGPQERSSGMVTLDALHAPLGPERLSPQSHYQAESDPTQRLGRNPAGTGAQDGARGGGSL